MPDVERSRDLARSFAGIEARRSRSYFPLDQLDRAELKVLRKLSVDASNGEIARELQMTEQVVGNHVLHILDKLALLDRPDAVRYARRSGLRAA